MIRRTTEEHRIAGLRIRVVCDRQVERRRIPGGAAFQASKTPVTVILGEGEGTQVFRLGAPERPAP